MYSSFIVDSQSTPINEISSPRNSIVNDDVKFSSASPFMLNIMTDVALANIDRFSVIIDTYIEYMIKVAEILTDQIILVRCYVISVFKVSQELQNEVISFWISQ